MLDACVGFTVVIVVTAWVIVVLAGTKEEMELEIVGAKVELERYATVFEFMFAIVFVDSNSVVLVLVDAKGEALELTLPFTAAMAPGVVEVDSSVMVYVAVVVAICV